MNVSKEKEEEDEMVSDLTKLEFVGFIFFVIINVVCNVLVCIVIRRSRRVQSTTNYFVASLSIADVLFSVLVMSFVTGDTLAGSWIFSDVICRVVRFVQYTLPGIVIYLLLSICADRYYKIGRAHV